MKPPMEGALHLHEVEAFNTATLLVRVLVAPACLMRQDHLERQVSHGARSLRIQQAKALHGLRARPNRQPTCRCSFQSSERNCLTFNSVHWKNSSFERWPFSLTNSSDKA